MLKLTCVHCTVVMFHDHWTALNHNLNLTVVFHNFMGLTIHYITKQDIRIYMLPLAGQTAGPIGVTFLVDTQGWPGGVLD